MSDILLTSDNELLIANGDFALGDSDLQDVGIILQLNQGELKSDPIMGPSLIRMINQKAKPNEIQNIVKLHITRDGKNFDDIKNKINYAF